MILKKEEFVRKTEGDEKMNVYLVKQNNEDYYEKWNVVAVCFSKKRAEQEVTERYAEWIRAYVKEAKAQPMYRWDGLFRIEEWKVLE